MYTFLVPYTSFYCYQLDSHLGVPSGNGLLAVPGFTIKWNNFLPIGKSIFLPPKFSDFFGKRPRLEYEISRIIAESLPFLVDSTLTLRTAVCSAWPNTEKFATSSNIDGQLIIKWNLLGY